MFLMNLPNQFLFKSLAKNSSHLTNLIKDKGVAKSHRNPRKLPRLEMMNSLIKMKEVKKINGTIGTKGMTDTTEIGIEVRRPKRTTSKLNQPMMSI